MRHGELKHIFDIFERSFTTLGIDFYLIGALARQVWYERGGLAFRTTRDVDYAVWVSSHEEYQRIREHLIESEGFSEYRGNDFVLIAPDGTQVDMLPFGEIESDGDVTISGQGMTSISVDGMSEVYNRGTDLVTLNTGHSFKVATLPAIALLKFIAYDDRPDQRQKDAIDITNMMLHFFTLHEELIYEHHHDLFDEIKIQRFESIGPIVLGREMRKIAESNERLVDRLNRIIEKHLQNFESSPFIRLMMQGAAEEMDMQLIQKYLSDIHWGFNHTR